MAEPEPNVLLRGSLEIDEGYLLYKGKWAFGKEGHAAKDTSKFELKSLSPVEFPGNENVDILFEGFFVLHKKEEDRKVKIKEEGVKLSFSKPDEGSSTLQVVGTGKNKMGDFSLSGMLDPTTKKLQLEKAYIEEDGEFSGSGSGSDEDSGSDIDAEEPDENDIADELADLRADQEQHGLILEEDGGAEDKEKTSRLKKKGGKRIVVKRNNSDDNGDVQNPQKKQRNDGSGNQAEEKKVVSLPIPTTSWEEPQLKETQERLNKMVEINDSLGIMMMLTDLSAHKINVALLQSTGIGKEVRALKKHSDAKVSTMSEAIVTMWKEIVKQENEA